jgi:AbrB family looped-hinge helix DNA binding protein
MTVVHMTEKGHIRVPKEIRDRRGFGNGSAFAVLETKAGALFFRPVQTEPKLVEVLRPAGHADCRYYPGTRLDGCDSQRPAFPILPGRKPVRLRTPACPAGRLSPGSRK